MNGARRKTNFLQPLLMGNINIYIYRSCVRDISQQTQNRHAFLWSRLGHEIDDEHDEDDLDSEDEHLVNELMVFNVDNDTSDVSEADE